MKKKLRWMSQIIIVYLIVVCKMNKKINLRSNSYLNRNSVEITRKYKIVFFFLIEWAGRNIWYPLLSAIWKKKIQIKDINTEDYNSQSLVSNCKIKPSIWELIVLVSEEIVGRRKKYQKIQNCII